MTEETAAINVTRMERVARYTLPIPIRVPLITAIWPATVRLPYSGRGLVDGTIGVGAELVTMNSREGPGAPVARSYSYEPRVAHIVRVPVAMTHRNLWPSLLDQTLTPAARSQATRRALDCQQEAGRSVDRMDWAKEWAEAACAAASGLRLGRRASRRPWGAG